MLSRKVDKVSKDAERTRDPRGLQVGETPLRWRRCLPAAELIRHSCHRRGLIWWKCHTVCKLQAARLLSAGQCKLSEQQVNSIPSLLLLFSLVEGSGCKRAAEKGNDPSCPGLCFLIKMLFHQQERKQSPQDTTKRLLYCEERLFEESNLKFADAISSASVCCDVPRAAFGRGFL